MIAQNTFTDGLIMDLNPLTTPKTVLTDALNATIITYDGEEFMLQNDKGNCKVERAKLSVGFIPIGMQEYGGIVYVASLNPETGVGELGAFPSPERDFSTTDFDDLAPSKFRTTDFLVNTGQTDLNEKTSIISKLIEPELLQLNPGDKFLVTFQLNDAIAGSPADEIDNVIKMNFYISKDPADRKLFKLRFYKVSEDNNLAEMDPDDVKLIQLQGDLEDEYVYFKEKNKGVIAVGLELETLDTFDISVVDTSKKTEQSKSAVIEAVGFSDSMADFEGVKIDLTLPEIQTFYINKQDANLKKVVARLTDLVADSKVSGTATPYSKYALYPKRKKDFNLELGKYASTGSGVSNIYRYKVNNNSITVDFDFKFQGNNDNGLVLYVEFYDPWSDYSIVKVVDNPSYYGVNPVVMELVDEPTTEIFDANQSGGTPNSKLIVNNDTTYIKTLLNSTNKIRTSSTLRRNHFYIVRFSGVDIDVTKDPTEYTHYDFYKGLYTNKMFNDIYDAQNQLAEGSPGYVADFNQLDFDISEVKFATETKEISNINQPAVITTQRDDLITSGRYYKISKTELSKLVPYKHVRKFQNNKRYSVKLSLTGTNGVFGDFRTELVSVTTPTIGNAGSNAVLKPTIVDQDYDNDPNIAPESTASWELNALDSTNYQILTETTTKRTVHAAVDSRIVVGNDYQEISMLYQLYYKAQNQGPFSSNRAAVAKYTKYSLEMARNDNSIMKRETSGRAFDDGNVDSALNDLLVPSVGDRAAIILTAPERTFFYPNRPGYDNCANRDPGGTASWKQSILVVRKTDGTWKFTRTHDLPTIVEFFSSLKVASNIKANLNAYYPTQDIRANRSVTTVVDYPELTITTNLTPSPLNTKTYLSKVIFKATGTTKVNFTTALVNNYIQSRISDSEILDGNKTVRDGFIPFITTTKTATSTINIPDTVLTQSADSSVVTKMAAGSAEAGADNTITTGRYEHGTLFTDNPNYQAYVQFFTIGDNYPKTSAITPGNIQLRIQNAGGEWDGKNSKVDRCDTGDQAPNMLPNIMITKT